MKLYLHKRDKVQEAVSIGLLASIFLILAASVPGLPEIIPIHFKLSGEADGYGSRNTLWLLSLPALLLYALLSFFATKPELYKYHTEVLEKEKLYRLTSKMIRGLKLSLLLFFNILTVFILQTVQGKWTHISPLLIVVMLAFVLAPVLLYLPRFSKLK